jgi:microcystin-dependent protein
LPLLVLNHSVFIYLLLKLKIMMEPFLGMISYYAFDFAPRNWAQCQGQRLAINTNQALFALLGTTFGGDGVTNFALPDLRGRAAIGQGISNVMGQVTGVENGTLPLNAMPVHIHSVRNMPMGAVKERSEGNDPTNAWPSFGESGSIYGTAITDGAFLGAPNFTVQSTGSNAPFSLMNPYTVLGCCISLQGIFPSRN